MKLISCYIENFGILHARSFSFKDGLNVFFDDNSSGKTTLSVFIKAMLYGIGDTRKANLDENERKKYAPWQGGVYGGSLTFATGGETYRIERTFGTKASDDTYTLYDEGRGRVSRAYGENLGEEIFGIDKDGFERTIFLSEKNIQDRNENKTIAGKLSDLVGVDGDIGEFDNAITLLDNRRRFYYKKGGSGEIANLRESLTEAEREYERILLAREKAKDKEAELARVKKKIDEAEAKKAEAIDRIKRSSSIKEKAMYEARYREMLAELEEEKRRLASLRTFFREAVPSVEEIEYAKESKTNAERLMHEATSTPSTERLTELEGIFGEGLDYSDFARMEQSALEVKRSEDTLELINAGGDEKTEKMNRLFPEYLPSKEEIENQVKTLGKKADGASVFSLSLGAILTLISAILGSVINPLLYIVMLAGIPLVVYGVYRIISRSERINKEAKAFIKKMGFDTQDPLDTLYTKASDRDTYTALYEEREFEKERLRDLCENLKKELDSFLCPFGSKEDCGYEERLRSARLMYAEYSTLSMSRTGRESERLSIIKKAEEERRCAADFLSMFNTKTDAPFEEIRRVTNEYRLTEMTVNKMTRDCENFAIYHGTTGKEIAEDSVKGISPVSLEEIEENLHALKREYALLENEYRDLTDICERLGEVIAAKEEYGEKVKRAEENLAYIQKTAQYLSEACDNITSKYIGKTKENFEKYTEIMTGKAAEGFALDTSFTLTKTEGGKTHPRESYSRGLKDLHALALRLALVGSLYDQNLPPLILDDPMTAFDDGNIERGKKLLKSLAKERQILYFTCSEARRI